LHARRGGVHCCSFDPVVEDWEDKVVLRASASTMLKNMLLILDPLLSIGPAYCGPIRL
jgi:hypothetical protein